MAADQQFCLRWNNHQSTLVSVFDSLLEKETLVDCTLAAEGQYLKAHKVVLCACSPYLETLLSQHYEKHPIVILKDVKFTELKSMMDYMYRGEVNISQDQLGTFLKAAESLQIKGLSENGEGDARDVGSTTKPPPRKPPATPAAQPELAQSPAHRSRDGSVSPSSRKRRRLRRNSDDGDNHLDSNSCDLPVQAQSTPVVPNIPASITTTPIRTPIVKPEVNDRLDHNSLPPESGLLKEKIEPAEPLLEPKTEYLEDLNNDDSVEDLTLDDDDEMDMSQMSNMSNMSRPGPSHGADISNQGFTPWQLGNQSGTDEVFMAAQEAVNAHRDSQDQPMCFLTTLDPSKPASKIVNIHIVTAEKKPKVRPKPLPKLLGGNRSAEQRRNSTGPKTELTEEQRREEKRAKDREYSLLVRMSRTDEEREELNRKQRERQQRMREVYLAVQQQMKEDAKFKKKNKPKPVQKTLLNQPKPVIDTVRVLQKVESIEEKAQKATETLQRQIQRRKNVEEISHTKKIELMKEKIENMTEEQKEKRKRLDEQRERQRQKNKEIWAKRRQEWGRIREYWNNRGASKPEEEGKTNEEQRETAQQNEESKLGPSQESKTTSPEIICLSDKNTQNPKENSIQEDDIEIIDLTSHYVEKVGPFKRTVQRRDFTTSLTAEEKYTRLVEQQRESNRRRRARMTEEDRQKKRKLDIDRYYRLKAQRDAAKSGAATAEGGGDSAKSGGEKDDFSNTKYNRKYLSTLSAAEKYRRFLDLCKNSQRQCKKKMYDCLSQAKEITAAEQTDSGTSQQEETQNVIDIEIGDELTNDGNESVEAKGEENVKTQDEGVMERNVTEITPEERMELRKKWDELYRRNQEEKAIDDVEERPFQEDQSHRQEDVVQSLEFEVIHQEDVPSIECEILSDEDGEGQQEEGEVQCQEGAVTSHEGEVQTLEFEVLHQEYDQSIQCEVMNDEDGEGQSQEYEEICQEEDEGQNKCEDGEKDLQDFFNTFY